MNVQAIITNINFPTDLDELRGYVCERGFFDLEGVLNEAELPDGWAEWTAPKWIHRDDIVFFFHAKTAISKITRLETMLRGTEGADDYEQLMGGLQRARGLYARYGGKIFAIGRVIGSPFYDPREGDESERSRKWRIFARIGDICALENPVPISDFSDFIRVSRGGATTPALGEEFARLKSIVAERNDVPAYFKESDATPFPLNEINSDNWLEVTQEHRRRFFLESQFRAFYVDHFLRCLSDSRVVYTECQCYKNGVLSGYADNGIVLGGKVCFVEVKLNLETEPHLARQLTEYCFVEKAQCEKGKWLRADGIVQRHVLIVDTVRIGVFSADRNAIDFLAELDDIKSEEDVRILKQRIASM